MSTDPDTIIEDLREELAELGSTTGLADIPGVWTYDDEYKCWRVAHMGGSGVVDVKALMSSRRRAQAFPSQRKNAEASGAIGNMGLVDHTGNIRETCAVVASILEDFAAKETT